MTDDSGAGPAPPESVRLWCERVRSMRLDELADFEERTFRQWDCASLGDLRIASWSPSTSRGAAQLTVCPPTVTARRDAPGDHAPDVVADDGADRCLVHIESDILGRLLHKSAPCCDPRGFDTSMVAVRRALNIR